MPQTYRKSRKFQFRQAGSLIASDIRKSGESRGFSVARILTHWADIVGPDLAQHTRPVKVRFARSGPGATLEVLVAGAHAPMVEMQKDRLRERVNAAYGYGAIGNIHLTQTAETGFAEGQAQFAAAPKTGPETPPPAALRRSHQIASDVKDDALRIALGQLGTNILTKPAPKGRS